MATASDTAAAVDWMITDQPVAYPEAITFMERRVAEIRAGTAAEAVWLLEHPPLYTAGTSADPAELIDAGRFPVFQTGRGGRYTYHGPGQRVAYVMLDLKRRGGDVRRYVRDLEQWVIETLAQFAVIGERREGRVGIWVTRGAPVNPLHREDKIAAIGVRVRQWVSFHGISINVEPDLGHFDGIVPCGIAEHGVTSLWDLGLTPTMPEVDLALRDTFERVFGRETAAPTETPGALPHST
jgi:lipoyl(octanoyl) transferase